MEEEPETQEGEQPPEDTGEEDEEIEVIDSIILEEDGPTTRKIQTEFTVPCKGPEAAAMAAAVKGAPFMPPGPIFQPCGDMPLPPGADPWQWGFPEFCPRKMNRYAEAAAAAATAVEAPDPEGAFPGEAADTLFDEEREEAGDDAQPPADEQPTENVHLSVLSEDEALNALGEEVVELEKSSSEVFEDAVGTEEKDEFWSDDDTAGSPEGGIQVDIKVELPIKPVADEGSVGFQAPAAEEEDGGPQEEAAPDQEEQQQQPAEEDASDAPQEMDTTDATGPVLWKIEQEIAVVRSKLSEMQQKITALDISDLSGGAKPAGLPVLRRKCVCDPQKKAADRALPAPQLPATGMPPAGANLLPETPERYGYHSAPCLQQFNQRQSFTNVAQDFRKFAQSLPPQFPQTGGGVDIYIASRSGNTSAVTSINPANFQQYAEKPVLKAFASPDVDVYVVTDNVAPSGYSGQS